MKHLIKIILLIIVTLGIFLRFYKLGSIPPSLSWDEASFSYNAYSIAANGQDEWGKNFPLSFESFGEYKNPVDIYITAPFIKIFGLNNFSTRLPAALFGVFNIILIYFLYKILFKNEIGALAASLILALSPYNLQFSRHHHELNIALFFFMLGIYFFYRGLKGKYISFIGSAISFCLCLLSYNAAKMFVPLMIIVLLFLYRKNMWSIKKHLIWCLVPLVLTSVILFSDNNLFGLARFKQTSVTNEKIYNTWLYRKTGNRRLGRVEIILKQYPLHYSWHYLFSSGDANPRHSIQTVGEFYRFDVVLLIAGFLYLIYLVMSKKSKEGLVMLSWALIAPIPSAVASEAPHAGRSMFMTGSWHIIAALGLVFIFSLSKNKTMRILAAFVVIIFYGVCVKEYLVDYYKNYSTKYSADWQYGYERLISDYSLEFPKFHSVVISDRYAQPYIFVLAYEKINPELFRQSVIYNPTEKWGFSTVSSFGKFKFKTIEESDLVQEALVFATPVDKLDREALGEIKFLDGSTAFWVYKR